MSQTLSACSAACIKSHYALLPLKRDILTLEKDNKVLGISCGKAGFVNDVALPFRDKKVDILFSFHNLYQGGIFKLCRFLQIDCVSAYLKAIFAKFKAGLSIAMEPLLGFLRGVVKDKELKPFGVHHAVQWSTTPHNTHARYRRYRIALYASYILGANEINTEEGLWHMEEYYNHHHRFGEACLSHLKQQADFFRYVSSHTRSGSLYSPFALIHGRDDGATFFGKDRTWGRRGMPQTPADDSWDLLKTIYPTSNPVERMYHIFLIKVIIC